MSIKLREYKTQRGMVVQVLYVGDQSVFYRAPDGSEGMVSIKYAETYWSEYKAPRTTTFFVNIYGRSDGGLRTGVVWGTKAEAIAASRGEVIDTMEITWTEKSDG